jgi:hypothetical protein
MSGAPDRIAIMKLGVNVYNECWTGPFTSDHPDLVVETTGV